MLAPVPGQVEEHRLLAAADSELRELAAAVLRAPGDLDAVAGRLESPPHWLGDRSGCARFGAEQVDVLGHALHQAVSDESVTAGERESAVGRGGQSNARDLGLKGVDTHPSGLGHIRTGAALAELRVALLPGGPHDARQVQLRPVPNEGVAVQPVGDVLDGGRLE